MPRLDLNCDLGEGIGHDADLMPLVTSANIACGAHAGDEETMRSAIALAKLHGTALGAHPGFDDRENFGRRELPVAPKDVYELVLGQIHILQRLAADADLCLTHVKLHGALYNMAARDATVAEAAALAVCAADPRLAWFGLAGSVMLRIGRGCGLTVASEVFADRTYQPDGSLTPRVRPDALIQNADAAVAQILRIAREGLVRATDGTEVRIEADTVCLHGDGPQAVAFAKRLNHELRRAGIEIKAFGA